MLLSSNEERTHKIKRTNGLSMYNVKQSRPISETKEEETVCSPSRADLPHVQILACNVHDICVNKDACGHAVMRGKGNKKGAC